MRVPAWTLRPGDVVLLAGTLERRVDVVRRNPLTVQVLGDELGQHFHPHEAVEVRR
jgi:hypothetical protein